MISEPRIEPYRVSFLIVRSVSGYEKQWWSVKRGEWLCSRGDMRRVTKFRTRAAAELELNRIRLCLTPEVPKHIVQAS